MRLVCKSDRFLQKKFQSTHPRGVRRHENGSSISLYLFQSTHPHGVRHELGSIERFLKSFNPRTHMGCDAHRFLRARLWRCFNPRTHMGCDLSVIGYTRSRKSFNPRTHMGCDPTITARIEILRVSIHAPTWGATGFQLSSMTCDLFQSTHPHGVRRVLAPGMAHKDVSIHAPTWGATHIQQISEYHITKVHYLRIICKFLNTYVNLMGI